MNKLQESLTILAMLCNDITIRNAIIVQHQLHKLVAAKPVSQIHHTHFMTFFKMTMIDTHSFMDEYDGFLGVKTEPVYNKKIVALKKILKPLHSKLKEWSDLGKFRNEFSAHNMRSKSAGDAFIFSVENLSYNAPRNFPDLILIGNVITLLVQAFGKEFSKEREGIEKIRPTSMIPPIHLRSKQEVSDSTITLILQINERLKNEGKSFQLDVQPSDFWEKV